MMPREQISRSSTLHTLFKFFKVVCYIFLFVIVLVSAVVNKLCVLLMTSSITKVSIFHQPILSFLPCSCSKLCTYSNVIVYVLFIV